MAKEFSLDNYLQSEDVPVIEYKESRYIKVPECLQKCIGFPGIPMGHSMMLYGLSDSGKTHLMLKMAESAIQEDVLPILIITENKLDRERALSMNLKHGVNCLIREDLAYLEDVYDYISMKIKDVKEGRLPKDVIFFWDSVASTPSKESFEFDKDGRIKKKFGPQKNASVIGYYNPLIMKMVTSTRQKDCKNTVSLFMLNQAYVKPAEFPGGQATIVPNGGEKIWFPLSLAIEIKEGKRLKATHKGRQVDFGLVSKIKVKKNHISELNASGEIVLAGNQLLENDEKILKTYKDSHKDDWEYVLEENFEE